MAGMLYLMHLSNQQKPDSLASTGRIAEAVVVDKLVSGMRNSKLSLVYEFENENTMVETVNRKNFASVKPGDKVEVCYNDTYFTAFFEKCGVDSK